MGKRIFDAVAAATGEGLVRAAHDLSEGGLAVAAAEMAFSGGLGVELDLSAVPAEADVPPPARLFAENAGRFLVEVSPDDYDAFLETIGDVPCGKVGRVTDSGRVVIEDSTRVVIDVEIARAKAAWQGTFDW